MILITSLTHQWTINTLPINFLCAVKLLIHMHDDAAYYIIVCILVVTKCGLHKTMTLPGTLRVLYDSASFVYETIFMYYFQS